MQLLNGDRVNVYNARGPIDAVRRVQKVVQTLTGSAVEVGSNDIVFAFNMRTAHTAKMIACILTNKKYQSYPSRTFEIVWREMENVYGCLTGRDW
jgi:hypothetical protein